MQDEDTSDPKPTKRQDTDTGTPDDRASAGKGSQAPRTDPPRSDDGDPVETHDVPGPAYRWGGYDESDTQTPEGYVNPEGFGPYATRDAAQPGHPDPRDPSHPARSNRDLGESVRLALLAEGRLSEGRLSLEVSQGVVTLQGEMPSEFLRTLAQRTTEAVPGVLVVHNHLDVADMGPGTED